MSLDDSPRFIRFATGLFIGIGALMIVGGIVLAFEDPAALALCLFGFVFGGMGFMARRFMLPPPGKEALELEAQEVVGPGRTSRARRFVYVDAGLDEDERERIRREHLQAAWTTQPDWVDGAILADGTKHSGLHTATAIAWTVFAIGALVVAWFAGDIWWLVAVGACVFAAVLGFSVLQTRARRRKFGDSEFLMEPCPAVLGGRVAGRVLTGVDQRQRVDEGFRVTLRCVHRYETVEYRGADRDRHTVWKSDTLWEREKRVDARASAKRVATLEVPVEFAVPADLPPASAAGGTDGIVWELSVDASLPGLDYASTFKLPVLDEATAHRIAHATAH